MTNNFHADTIENIEVISYNPSYQNSGDLEEATRQVTATGKPGEADYSAGLFIPVPDDARFVVKRVGVRLSLTIDSMTAGHLYGAIHVNGVERKTFDLSSTGTFSVVLDLTEGQFNLGNNSYEVYLWVDADQAVISACQVWQGVGSTESGYYHPFCLLIDHTGLLQLFGEVQRIGSGSVDARIGQDSSSRPSVWYNLALGQYGSISPPLMLASGNGVSLRPNSAGDLACFYGPMKAMLRHER